MNMLQMSMQFPLVLVGAFAVMLLGYAQAQSGIIPIIASLVVSLLVLSITAARLWKSRWVRAYQRLGKVHEVFLSFRGTDTGKGFAHNLYEALEGKGFPTFFADETLKAGDEIAKELVRAIDEAKISVVIISENYVTSHWCLDELVRIIDCKKSKNQRVIPVFYKTNPSDVRRQLGRLSLERWECTYEKRAKILEWKEALTNVGNLTGIPFTEERYETTLIDDIVQQVSDA